MKRLLFLSILTLGLSFYSCNKDDDSSNVDNFAYKATVISQGHDCGETFLISLESIASNTSIENGTYYADDLDSEYKVEGLKIYLNCREPNTDEVYVCTTLGPTYPHVVVTACKKAED